MAEFIRRMWEQGLITQSQLEAYCPIFLTTEEKQEILGCSRRLTGGEND